MTLDDNRNSTVASNVSVLNPSLCTVWIFDKTPTVFSLHCDDRRNFDFVSGIHGCHADTFRPPV